MKIAPAQALHVEFQSKGIAECDSFAMPMT